MILYLDTSSLVKLYVEETGTDEVRRLVDQALVVTTSIVAYPEARSAFARLYREGGLTADEHSVMKADLERDLESFLTLGVTEEIWRHAGDLTEAYALRGFDSLHLASYLALTSLEFSHPVRFSSFDDRLSEAAARTLLTMSGSSRGGGLDSILLPPTHRMS